MSVAKNKRNVTQRPLRETLLRKKIRVIPLFTAIIV
jgi:hypothetical protein